MAAAVVAAAEVAAAVMKGVAAETAMVETAAAATATVRWAAEEVPAGVAGQTGARAVWEVEPASVMALHRRLRTGRGPRSPGRCMSRRSP